MFIRDCTKIHFHDDVNVRQIDKERPLFDFEADGNVNDLDKVGLSEDVEGVIFVRDDIETVKAVVACNGIGKVVVNLI